MLVESLTDQCVKERSSEVEGHNCATQLGYTAKTGLLQALVSTQEIRQSR